MYKKWSLNCVIRYYNCLKEILSCFRSFFIKCQSIFRSSWEGIHIVHNHIHLSLLLHFSLALNSLVSYCYVTFEMCILFLLKLCCVTFVSSFAWFSSQLFLLSVSYYIRVFSSSFVFSTSQVLFTFSLIPFSCIFTATLFLSPFMASVPQSQGSAKYLFA